MTRPALAPLHMPPELQNSQESGTALLHRCRAYVALKRYDDAIATCEKSRVTGLLQLS